MYVSCAHGEHNEDPVDLSRSNREGFVLIQLDAEVEPHDGREEEALFVEELCGTFGSSRLDLPQGGIVFRLLPIHGIVVVKSRRLDFQACPPTKKQSSLIFGVGYPIHIY